MLEHVLVLQQKLVYAGLGLQPSCSLSSQLILQQVNLQREGREDREETGQREERDMNANESCQWMARTRDALYIQLKMKPFTMK